MEALGATAAPLGNVGEPWDGTPLAFQTGQLAPVSPRVAVAHSEAAKLPLWAGGPPDWLPSSVPVEPRRPTPLAPSRPVDARLGPVPPAASPLSGAMGAAERGTLIHQLLQHAPSLPVYGRHDAIRAFIAASSAPLAIADEVAAIMEDPTMSALFGPDGRAEQPLAGYVNGTVVSGIVDRLAVLPGEVLVADYKTHRDAPASAQDTPVLYLRQMAAYRAVLRAVFPGRKVRCVLIWTRTATVSVLPNAILDEHEPGQLDPPINNAHFSGPTAGDIS
jgi:ATP-dependent helicase/nuclease subunit A